MLLLLFSLGRLLKRYRLLYAYGGVISDPGWTDDHVVLPALLIFVPAIRKGMTRIAGKIFSFRIPGEALPLAGIFALVFIGWGILLGLVPWL